MSRPLRLIFLAEFLFILAFPFALGISPGRWYARMLRDIAVVLAALFVFFPPYTVGVLSLLRLPGAAVRYAAWTARHHLLPALRRIASSRAASLFLEAGDTTRAVEYADRGIALSEPHLDRLPARQAYAVCINIKGVCALNAGRYREALTAFHRPLRMELKPPAVTALLQSNCASALVSLGEFDDALDFARRAQATAPSHPALILALARLNAATALLEMGKADEALREIEPSLPLKVAPRYQTIRAATWGWALWQSGDTAGAERAFAQAEAAGTHLPAAQARYRRQMQTRRGQMRLAQGRWDDAEADLTAAAGGEEVNPAAWFFLAKLADARGDEAKTRRWRERLEREVPESFYARRAAEGIIPAR